MAKLPTIALDDVQKELTEMAVQTANRTKRKFDRLLRQEKGVENPRPDRPWWRHFRVELLL